MTLTPLYFIVEGESERDFVMNVLRPHLNDFQVDCIPIIIATRRDKKRPDKTQRGGGRGYKKTRLQVKNTVKMSTKRGAYVTTMLDLYALSNKFPGFDEAKKIRDPYDKISCLERAFEQDISCFRFIPYIQLHEYEAILFSDVTWFTAEFLELNDEQITRLQQIVDSTKDKNPELINDKYETCPSRRIKNIIPEYRKPESGWEVANAIGIERIRQKCKHFNQWLTRLETLPNSVDPC